MVRDMGLEPIRPLGHQHLKLACLPIPATPHNGGRGRIRTYSTSGNGFTDRRSSPTLPLSHSQDSIYGFEPFQNMLQNILFNQ